MRKVIQIVVEAKQYSDGSRGHHLIALCDDGTIWRLIAEDRAGLRRWERVAGPPGANHDAA